MTLSAFFTTALCSGTNYNVPLEHDNVYVPSLHMREQEHSAVVLSETITANK